MIDMPIFLQDETEETIRNRMLSKLPDELDKTEGSMPFDTQAPLAAELAQAKDETREFLRQGFVSTAAGKAGEVNPFVDLRIEEHGVTRRFAQKSKGTAKFTGTPGAQVPAETLLSTASTATTKAIVFKTLAICTIGGDGTATAAIEALEAGTQGNIAVGKIIFIVSSFTDMEQITGVTNEFATAGGLDIEDDPSAFDRYLRKVRSNSAGGNKADYINWALEVPGVGGVAVVPVRDGPGTVSVAIIDINKAPANQALIDTAQDYIAPPWRNKREASTFILSGSGVTYEGTVNGVKWVYNAGAEGQATYNLLNQLQQPGIWQARVSLKVDSAAGNTNLLQIGIWNKSLGAWAKISPSSGTDALLTIQANDLATIFAEGVLLDYYWNGMHELELRINRKQTDTTTTVYMNYTEFRSTFSKDTGEAKAPSGHRVTVEAAATILINISVHLVLKSGTAQEDGEASANQAMNAYLSSIAYMTDNDVGYNKLGNAILAAEGIADHTGLTINGGTANIPIPEQSVAIKGTVSFI